MSRIRPHGLSSDVIKTAQCPSASVFWRSGGPPAQRSLRHASGTTGSVVERRGCLARKHSTCNSIQCPESRASPRGQGKRIFLTMQLRQRSLICARVPALRTLRIGCLLLVTCPTGVPRVIVFWCSCEVRLVWLFQLEDLLNSLGKSTPPKLTLSPLSDGRPQLRSLRLR